MFIIRKKERAKDINKKTFYLKDGGREIALCNFTMG